MLDKVYVLEFVVNYYKKYNWIQARNFKINIYIKDVYDIH